MFETSINLICQMIYTSLKSCCMIVKRIKWHGKCHSHFNELCHIFFFMGPENRNSTIFNNIHTIVHNILQCIGKHSFHTNANEWVCYQNIRMFFFYTFYLKINKCYLIINNEYKSMVFTILRGRLPYANDWNLLECEWAYGSYY